MIQNDWKTYRLLSKSTLLTFIALFTTVVTLVLAAILGLASMFTAIDSVVNCWWYVIFAIALIMYMMELLFWSMCMYLV